MKSYVHFRNIAIDLRENGHSVGEIARKLNISKTTVSRWLRGMRLKEEQMAKLKSRVEQRMQRGRLNASISNKSRRIVKENTIYREAEKEIVNLINDSFFVFGLSIYAIKGSKRGNISLTTSDGELLNIMVRWFSKYLNIDSTDIKVKKYGKMHRLYFSDVDRFRKIMSWQKLLIQYYSNVLKIE